MLAGNLVFKHFSRTCLWNTWVLSFVLARSRWGIQNKSGEGLKKSGRWGSRNKCRWGAPKNPTGEDPKKKPAGEELDQNLTGEKVNQKSSGRGVQLPEGFNCVTRRIACANRGEKTKTAPALSPLSQPPYHTKCGLMGIYDRIYIYIYIYRYLHVLGRYIYRYTYHSYVYMYMHTYTYTCII